MSQARVPGGHDDGDRGAHVERPEVAVEVVAVDQRGAAPGDVHTTRVPRCRGQRPGEPAVAREGVDESDVLSRGAAVFAIVIVNLPEVPAAMVPSTSPPASGLLTIVSAGGGGQVTVILPSRSRRRGCRRWRSRRPQRRPGRCRCRARSDRPGGSDAQLTALRTTTTTDSFKPRLAMSQCKVTPSTAMAAGVAGGKGSAVLGRRADFTHQRPGACRRCRRSPPRSRSCCRP